MQYDDKLIFSWVQAEMNGNRGKWETNHIETKAAFFMEAKNEI